MPSFSLALISILSVSVVVACSSSGEEAPPTGDAAAGSGGMKEGGAGSGGTPEAGADAPQGTGGADAEADALADVTEDVETDAITDASVCMPEDGADACEMCEDASCCAEKTACYANDACLAADSALDTCLDAADGGEAGVALCHATFAASGAQAQALSTCEKTNCMACGVP